MDTSNLSETNPLRLLICDTCQRDSGSAAEDRAELDRHLAAAGLDDRVVVAASACLGGCATPASIAGQSDGRASYVFSGLTIASDAPDIIAFCQTYLAATDGWIEDARPLGRLRHCLRARIPALPGGAGR